MSAFNYSAIDTKGTKRQGVIQAENARLAREQLRKQGLMPLSVDAIAGAFASVSRVDMVKVSNKVRMSLAQVLAFTRQLSALLQGAVPLSEALNIIARQSEAQNVKRVALALRVKLQEGHSLSEALKQFPNIFPVFYVANVAGAERIGVLEKVLEQLTEVLEKDRAARQKLLLALLYPSILVTVSVAVTLFLMGYVVPTLVAAFESTNHELPFITQLMLKVSTALRAALPLLAFSIAAGTIGGVMMLKNPGGKEWLHSKILSLPMLGTLIRTSSAARFGRTVGMLYGSGVSLMEALELSCQAEGNLAIRAKMQNATERVRQGQKLHSALEEAGCFPLIFTCMVASGEEGGRLKELLMKASDYHEEELRQRIAVTIHLLEPLILLFVGAVVLLVVISVLLPIINLNQQLG